MGAACCFMKDLAATRRLFLFARIVVWLPYIQSLKIKAYVLFAEARKT